MHLTRGAIGDFKSAFQLPDYYVDLGVMLEAQEHDSQFNIIDNTTGLKVDVMSAADMPHNCGRFQRAIRVELVPSKFVVFFARRRDPDEALLFQRGKFRQAPARHCLDVQGEWGDV